MHLLAHTKVAETVNLRAAIVIALTFVLLPVAAQRAPNAPDPEQVRAQIAVVRSEITRNQSARERVDRELRDLQSQIERLRVEQQRLAAEQSRLQSELIQLQTAPR